MKQPIVLLFAHGGGFNKRGWNPIIRLLQDSQFLHRIACDYVAHDFRYHGEKHDNSTPASTYVDKDVGFPLVQHHAGEWPEWGPRDLLDIVKGIRAKYAETRIIGIGHSMGAASLLKAETTLSPGTFDGLILFEPIINLSNESGRNQQEAMINATLKRDSEWDTWEEVTNSFETNRFFRRWDKESLKEHILGAVYESKSNDNRKRFQLACPPLQEASLYCHKGIRITVSDLARAKCPMFFHYGDKSHTRPLIQISNIPPPLPKTVVCRDDIVNGSHSFLFEWPKLCAERIIEDLEEIPSINESLIMCSL